MEGYKTVRAEYSAEIEVKKSRFIATVIPCKTEAEASESLAKMRKKYWDARHNVYAFSLRENGTKRFSDDGEPHSTAGLPVMQVIQHFGVTDVLVVVTRYFGGVLLGTGGLVRAYSEATRTALQQAEIKTILPAKKFTVSCDYGDYDLLLKLLESVEHEIISTDFSDRITICAVVSSSCLENFFKKCTDTFCGKMPFLNIEEIFWGFS